MPALLRLLAACALLACPAAFANSPPPPPTIGSGSGAQSELDAKIKAYFVGGWRLEYTDTVNNFQHRVEIWYREDGTMKGADNVTWPPPYGGGQKYDISGRYTLQAMDETTFTLTLIPDGAAQRSSVMLKIVDEDTLFNEQANQYPKRMK